MRFGALLTPALVTPALVVAGLTAADPDLTVEFEHVDGKEARR